MANEQTLWQMNPESAGRGDANFFGWGGGGALGDYGATGGMGYFNPLQGGGGSGGIGIPDFSSGSASGASSGASGASGASGGGGASGAGGAASGGAAGGGTASGGAAGTAAGAATKTATAMPEWFTTIFGKDATWADAVKGVGSMILNWWGKQQQADQAGRALEVSEQRRRDAMAQMNPQALMAALTMYYPGLFGSVPTALQGSAGDLASQNIMRWLSGTSTPAVYEREQEQANNNLNALRALLGGSAGGPASGANAAVMTAGVQNLANARNEAVRNRSLLEEQQRQAGFSALQQALQQIFGLQGARANVAQGGAVPQVAVTDNAYLDLAKILDVFGANKSSGGAQSTANPAQNYSQAYVDWRNWMNPNYNPFTVRDAFGVG